MRTKKATLENGQEIEYLPEIIGEGGMKIVHFTTDRSSVVCFFKDESAANDPERRTRLQAIVDRFNPTLDPSTGPYWENLYCWPTGIVVKPKLGVLAPAYPKNFFFGSGPLKGEEKQASWFTSPKLRKMLPDSEKGDWLRYLQICVRVARAVRRMHVAGLAHSDLSHRNVLMDPTTGGAVVIDIDSLVVRDLYPPDVLGTPGYIAPEVLATMDLDLDDSKRVLPSRETDQYALAVLIYEYLLNRHPLRGTKVHSPNAEEDEYLSMGPKALWIEDPNDTSNRRPNLKVPVSALGPSLAGLFKKVFVDGLHHPEQRPGANEWEAALVRTIDLLVPCRNSSCEHKLFVFTSAMKPRCPFCGTEVRGTMPVLNFYRERRPGQFAREEHRLVVRENQYFYRWHVYDNLFAGERADRTPLGYFVFHGGRWYLVNQSSESMSVVGSGPVPAGGYVELEEGARIRLSDEPHGRLALVQMVRS